MPEGDGGEAVEIFFLRVRAENEARTFFALKGAFHGCGQLLGRTFAGEISRENDDAVAGQVNQNFADVKSAIDPLQTDVANIKTQLTSGIVLPDGSVDFTRLQSYKTYVVSK